MYSISFINSSECILYLSQQNTHNADFEKANFVWTYGIYKAPVAFFWYSLIPQIISELPKNIHSKLQIFSGTNHFFCKFYRVKFRKWQYEEKFAIFNEYFLGVLKSLVASRSTRKTRQELCRCHECKKKNLRKANAAQ